MSNEICIVLFLHDRVKYGALECIIHFLNQLWNYTFLEPTLKLYISWTNFGIYISWTNFEHIHECSHFMNDGIWEDKKPKGWIIFVSKVAHAFKSWILIWVGVGVSLHMKRPWVFPYLPIQLVSKGNLLNSERMGFIYLYHN